MEPSPGSIAITIAALALVAVLVWLSGRNQTRKRLTPLAGLAFAFILAGIFFKEDRLLSYGLPGVGVILAVIDIVRTFRNKSRKADRQL